MKSNFGTMTGGRALAALLTTAALILGGCTTGSSSPSSPSSPSSSLSLSSSPTSRGDTKGSAFADNSLVHSISLSFEQTDFDKMIEAYKSSRTKEWIKATVTIDGDSYRDAGVRLKGNSSLFGISGGPVVGDLPIAARCLPPTDGSADGPGIPPGNPPIAGGFPGSSADAGQPRSLPWLIRLDKYKDGQAHQGRTDFVVRSSATKTAMNEAVALGLLKAAGLASQEPTGIRFAVNGSDPTYRLVIENPNDEWMAANFSAKAKLYKADATGDYSYRGADPANYKDVWSQDGGDDDITPLITFLDFVNNASDTAFAAELPARFDIASFARYLAIEELMGNFDDIDGPGNNSYLLYDEGAKKFTVVAWDHNLAFIASGFPGGGFPDGGFPGGGPPPGIDLNDLPEGCVRGADAQSPTQPTGEGAAGSTPRSVQRLPRRGFGGNNPLVTRFRGVERFQALHTEAVRDLKKELISSGTADELVNSWSERISTGASDLVDRETVANEAASIRSAINLSK